MRPYRKALAEYGGVLGGVLFFALWFYAIAEFGAHQGGDQQAANCELLMAGHGSLFVKQDGAWVRKFAGEHEW